MDVGADSIVGYPLAISPGVAGLQSRAGQVFVWEIESSVTHSHGSQP